MLLAKKDGYTIIMKKFSWKSRQLVDYYKKKIGAYNRKEINILLGEKTDKEIAELTQLSEELIAEIREEEAKE